MNISGMNTADSDSVIDRIVNPTSRDPSSAACMGGFPISRWRTMFSSITIASSTTKPTASVSAISDRLSMLKFSSVHDRERADDRHRQREARDQGRHRAAQEQEDHHHHEAERDDERELHVVHRLLDRYRPVVLDVHLHRSRQPLLDLGERRLDGVWPPPRCSCPAGGSPPARSPGSKLIQLAPLLFWMSSSTSATSPSRTAPPFR